MIIGFKEYWGGQFGNPTGFGGKIVTFLMNIMNKPMREAIIQETRANTKVLDIGFGNGCVLKKMLHKSDSQFFGIDISADMVKTAKRKNKKAIKSGRLELAQASVQSIPFNHCFGQIYTANTVYFWEDLSQGLSEIYNKLEKDGVFLNVCYTKEWLDKLGYTKNYKKYSKEELLEATKNVGFKAEIITVQHHKSFYIKATK